MAWGAGVDYVDLQSRAEKYSVEYTLQEDFSVERVTEMQIKVLSDKAVKNFKEQRFSHSTSIEKFEVLEAYTLKVDGKKIEVPEGNYQITVNQGKGENEAIFSDRTTVIIVFPELEKDDSIYMKLKNIETEPMFPDNFSASQFFWSQRAYDDVKISFNLPKGLHFRHQVRGMKEKITNRDGRKIIKLTYQNKKPVKVDRRDFGVWDESKEAGFALSTFNDYSAVAKAYGERALPKAVPTERVKKLAKKISSKVIDKQQKAQLLYDWVATNISYAGNCIGVGAVVPHNIDFILDNRMGDCKDHATLLQALYSSVGIESTQALINAGSSYVLPEVPLVTAINHVINYVPEWDKFIDSTNPSMPFDTLALSLSDKPVLLVENFIPEQRTPATQVGDNQQQVSSTMKIQADGSVKGDIHFKLKGAPAIRVRSAWRDVTQEDEDKWLERTFSSRGVIGSATMEKDDPTPLLSEYNYSFEFNKPEFILPEGTGGFYIGALVDSANPIYAYLDYPEKEIDGYDIACSNGYSSERLTYEFPENMKILAKPDDFEIKENHIYFKATYKLDGNILKVVREIKDETPGNVCSSEIINPQRKTLKKISKNIKVQVIYQH